MTIDPVLIAGALLVAAAAFFAIGAALRVDGDRERGEHIFGNVLLVVSFVFVLGIVFCVIP